MTVIGPINGEDWYWLRQLKSSINHAKDTNPKKFFLMIKSYEETYSKELKRLVS